MRHLSLFCLLLGLCPRLVAASIGAGDVVALSGEALIRVDIDSGQKTTIPIGHFQGSSQWDLLAADTDSLFAMKLGTFPQELVDLATLDLASGQWDYLRSEASVTFASDMETTPGGGLLIATEFGLTGLDPETGGTFDSGVNWPPDTDWSSRGGARKLEVDSSGAIITDFTALNVGRSLLRQHPEIEQPDRYDISLPFVDYTLKSAWQLIGLGADQLFQLDLETGASQVIFQGDILSGADRIQTDSAGRILLLKSDRDEPGANQLVRLDLVAGTQQTVSLDAYVTDFQLIPSAATPLMAGDADQDLDFDQFDLVRVLQAAKYLTGAQATWGEGDWDGAPGGRPGSPPEGDGSFDQLDIVAALASGVYLTGPYGALRPDGQRADARTSLVYDARTGELAVDAPAGAPLTSINIDSAAGIFTGSPAENLGGSFDHDGDSNIFKATFGASFASLSFGTVAPPGLAEEFLRSDLTVVGSLAGGGALGDVDLIYVPEPAGIALLGIALLAFAASRRYVPR
jgi:hypothetical protein